MLVLGIDPSLSGYGWSYHETSAKGRGRLINKGYFSTKSSMVFVDRYSFMRDSLLKVIRKQRPDKVGIESVAFGDTWTPGAYGLFLYTNEALRIEKLDVVHFGPMQLKMHARETLGRPDGWKMDKPDMIAAAKKDIGGGNWNHNEADAYLIARLSGLFWDFVDGLIEVESLSPVESKLFTRIHTYKRGKKAGKTELKGIMYREDDVFFRWSQIQNQELEEK